MRGYEVLRRALAPPDSGAAARLRGHFVSGTADDFGNRRRGPERRSGSLRASMVVVVARPV